MNWIVLGAVFGGLSVAAGAFAAHGLEAQLSERYLAVFKTGAEYQMTHSLALIAVGILAQSQPSAWLTWAGSAFTLGIVLFSGSLYLLATTGVTKWGMVTPIGGVLFLIGWGSLAIAALAAKPHTPAR
jgi:uncharacterized membrane protein YgdD (TMEM256/DUF423 family)